MSKSRGSVFLALVIPGAGHATIGRFMRAFVVSCALSATTALFAYGAADGSVPRAILGVVLSIAVYVASIVDFVLVRRNTAEVPHAWMAWLAVIALFVSGRAEGFWYRAEVVEAFSIPSSSMIPTLEIGDHVFVDKRDKTPSAGDVIVFRKPGTGLDFVKRVIATGGQTIEIRDGVPIVDGRALVHWNLDDACSYVDGGETRACHAVVETIAGRAARLAYDVQAPASFAPMKIPAGSYFVMGDNRDNSVDSRTFGSVPGANVKGTARFVWWSRDRHRIGSTIR